MQLHKQLSNRGPNLQAAAWRAECWWAGRMVLIPMALGCAVEGVPKDVRTKYCRYRSIHTRCLVLPDAQLPTGQFPCWGCLHPSACGAMRMARTWRRLCPRAFLPPCPVPEPRSAGESWKRRRSESVAFK